MKSETDWARVRATSDSEIERQAIEDDFEVPVNWREMAVLSGRLSNPEETGKLDANVALDVSVVATDMTLDVSPVAIGSDKIEVTSEQVFAGRRKVEQGGIRVTKHVLEVPVDEQVTLYEERVTIARSPADAALVVSKSRTRR